jgi:hypothetical protein
MRCHGLLVGLLAPLAIAAPASITTVIDNTLEIRQATSKICAYPGIPIQNNALNFAITGSLDNCRTRCQANSRCQSLAFGFGICVLYSEPAYADS